MKTLRRLFLLALLPALIGLTEAPAQAALDSINTVWEVRPTNGSDSNGSCFVAGSTGTDFSQQNSPQQVYTDLVAASTTTITSVARAFSSVDVGNCLNITSGSGWTTGIYQIASVSSGTATMDRAIATNGSTGGHGNLGGSMQNYSSLPGLGSTYSLADVNAYVKNEATITVTARPDFQNSGLQMVQLIGYSSSRGDGGQAVITTSNGTDSLLFFRGNGSLFVQNMKFTDTSSTRHQATGYLNSMNFLIYVNDTFDGNVDAIQGTSGTQIIHLLIKGCEIKNQTSDGLSLYQTTGLSIENSYIHDNAGNGLAMLSTAASANIFIFRSTFRANAMGIKDVDDGAVGANSSLYIYNSIIASNTSDGIKHVGTGSNFAVMTHIENTVIYGNGGFGVNVVTSGPTVTFNVYGANNAYGSNTSGARNNYPTLPGDISLTADPFVAASSGNFSLNNTAGGGKLLRAAGLKNTNNSPSADFPDVGAVQHGDPKFRIGPF